MMHLSEHRIVVSTDPIENQGQVLCCQKRGILYLSKVSSEFEGYLVRERNGIYYLDRFIMLLPKDYSAQGLLWTEFYRIYGEKYEQLIDISKNLKSMKVMLDYIKPCKGDIILDFGCGSGLASKLECEAKLLGYEIIPEMRKQARKKGYNILDEMTFHKLPEEYFDAGFANFVFHMSIEEQVVKEVVSKLKTGAVFLANYYKNLNSDRMNQYFQDAGCNYNMLPYTGGLGTIYEYRKQ